MRFALHWRIWEYHMNEEDWWVEIEKYLLAGDWTGVLVAADGLQDLGLEGTADTLSWMARKRLKVNLFNWREGPEYSVWLVSQEHVTGKTSCKELVSAIDRERNVCLEFYT